MKVDIKGHTTTLRNTQGDCLAFLDKVTTQYQSYKEQNLILDMSQDKDITLKEIKLFGDLSKMHKKAKKSFVIVVDGIDFNIKTLVFRNYFRFRNINRIIVMQK